MPYRSLWLVGVLVATPALADPTMDDYWRLCGGDRQADQLCRRLANQIHLFEIMNGAAEKAAKDYEEMRAKGCVQLTDQVYATMPPQYDWVCPPEVK